MSNEVDECDHRHDLSIKAWTFGTGDKNRVPTFWRRVQSETQQSNAEQRGTDLSDGGLSQIRVSVRGYLRAHFLPSHRSLVQASDRSQLLLCG